MAGQNSAKGNPAHVRMSNAKRKTRMSLSWQRAQKKHERLRKSNEAAAKANKAALQEYPASALPIEMGSQTKVHRGGGNPGRPSKVLRYLKRAAKRA